ncbi:MAG: rhodanese-like domain-containing protein [Cyanobacteria bacterium]|jgi:rhodanese-related sulfurtransferase|nr:rhodanese-like domain-containing protein [Cyanobacteriota bacterium]
MTLIPSRHSSGGDLTPEAFARLPHPPPLIDVRSGLEYGLFHAPQARNVSLPRLLLGRLPLLRSRVLPPWLRALPKTEAIAVICLTAHRSPMAAQALAQAGFTTIFNITGGMLAWQKAGLPVCKGQTARL